MKKVYKKIGAFLVGLSSKANTSPCHKEEGMEMIQVAILIAIAIILGLIFKTEITNFVNKTFESLNSGF